MSEILMMLLKLILTVTIPAATAAITYLFKRYIDEFVTLNMQNEIGLAVRKGVDTIIKSANYVSQTYVDGLKSEDRFDAEAQKRALEKAKKRAIELMSADTKAALEMTYGGNLEKYVETVIESYLKKKKTN